MAVKKRIRIVRFDDFGENDKAKKNACVLHALYLICLRTDQQLYQYYQSRLQIQPKTNPRKKTYQPLFPAKGKIMNLAHQRPNLNCTLKDSEIRAIRITTPTLNARVNHEGNKWHAEPARCIVLWACGRHIPLERARPIHQRR